MPKTKRVDVLSVPNTSTSNSDAASATLACSRNSGVVTREIPRRTTRVTLSSDPICSLASASAFNENVDIAIRFGQLEDSSVVATRIGKSIRYVVAAAEYLKGRKLPVEPADLKLHDCVYRGHGIGLLPSTYCDEAIASGALVRLLPKWASPQIPVFAVYSNRKFLPLRLSVFLNALAAWKSPLWIKE